MAYVVAVPHDPSHSCMGPSALPEGDLLDQYRPGVPVTNDLAERIETELIGSLGDPSGVLSVHIREGWGDISYVTIRVHSSRLHNRDEFGATLKSAVTSALGDARHLVKIAWD